MKVFYSYSNHNNSSDVYLDFCKKVNDEFGNNIEIYDIDNCNGPLLDEIFSSIDKCDLFICDITPDGTTNNKEFWNANVMIEIGYALKSTCKFIPFLDLTEKP